MTPRHGAAPGRPEARPHADRPACAGEVELWIAERLYRRHPDASVRVLEAVAATLANRRARGGGPPGAPPASPMPADQRARLCRRIARRVLAQAPAAGRAGATRYHRADAEPPWARGRAPSAELGGLLFYDL